MVFCPTHSHYLEESDKDVPYPSSYILLNGEVINLKIKSNEKIVGYSIPNQKEQLRLSQYATFS